MTERGEVPTVTPLRIPTRASLRKQPLESQRTLLVPLDVADSPALWEAVEGSRWHLERWLSWVPFTNSPEASHRFTEASVIDWETGRALRFGVRDRTSHQLLGVVGLDACVHLHQAAELGYWLRREATGKGLMTEAAGAVLEFGFRTLGLHRVRCAAATDNMASQRVIARLGFRFEGISRHAELVGARWLDHAVFGKLSTDP